MKKKTFGIQRITSFQGRRKIGIDANVLIKIYKLPGLFDYEESRIFNYKDLIFTHSICNGEFIRYLMKENGLSLEDAKKEAKTFLKEHNINRIFSKDCFIPKKDANRFEKHANSIFKKKNIDSECHKPDSYILLAFKKCGINKVFSTDLGFREAAKLLGMDSSGLPSLDYVISRKLRDSFHKRRKR